jgi:hypothetical protein
LEAYRFISKTCLCFVLYFSVHTKTDARSCSCMCVFYFLQPSASNTVWYHTMHEGVIKFFENFFFFFLIKMQVFSEWSIDGITCRRTTKISRCLNLGSYNYLGFAASDEYCTPRVIESLRRFSPSTCSARVDGGMQIPLQYVSGYVTEYALRPFLIRNYDTAYRTGGVRCKICPKASCCGLRHGLCDKLGHSSCPGWKGLHLSIWG